MMRRLVFPSLLTSFFGAFAASAAPLKVYILTGQSNMQGHAHVRTIDVIEDDPSCAAMLKRMRQADGSPTVCDDVWISAIGSSDGEKTGPLAQRLFDELQGIQFGEGSDPFGWRLAID